MAHSSANASILTAVREYYADRARVVVAVSVGAGYFYRLPGDKPHTWKKYMCDREMKLSDVLNDIDDKVGLEIPIFLFGFFKLNRSISCRSDRRVPTHIVLRHGEGYSTDRNIQGLGRGAFIGKSTLEENIGQGGKVKLLTSRQDYNAALAHQSFVLEIQKLLDEGYPFKDAWREAVVKFNYKSETKRRVGQTPKGALCKHFGHHHDVHSHHHHYY